MKTVVINGADGFIGSHLTRHLVENGFVVYALILEKNDLTKQRLDGLKNVHILAGTMDTHLDQLSHLPQNPVAFFHLAWAGVSPEMRNDVEYQQQNITLSLRAVDLAARLKAERFILPGSTMEYAFSGKIINAHALPAPQNAYGAVKIACRYLCQCACEKSGMAFVYTVLSSIYSEDRKDSNVIYYTISSLLKHETPQFTALEQLWDYVHIDDVVEAFRRIALMGKHDAFYCIGHGDNQPLKHYIYQIRDLINPKAEMSIGAIPYQNAHVPCSCVDLSSLMTDTGFQPAIPFEVGIRRVIDQVKREYANT